MEENEKLYEISNSIAGRRGEGCHVSWWWLHCGVKRVEVVARAVLGFGQVGLAARVSREAEDLG